MPFLDFLKPKGGNGKKPPDAQRADIDAALAKIAQERAAAQEVLDGLEQRRESLLLADAPESEIVKLDAEGDHARIKLEKLDIFEAEVHARLSELNGVAEEPSGVCSSTLGIRGIIYLTSTAALCGRRVEVDIKSRDLAVPCYDEIHTGVLGRFAFRPRAPRQPSRIVQNLGRAMRRINIVGMRRSDIAGELVQCVVTDESAGRHAQHTIFGVKFLNCDHSASRITFTENFRKIAV
jgi:hypothetical protein